MTRGHIALIFWMASCGMGFAQTGGKSETTVKAEAELAEQLKLGRRQYFLHCASCHMANGLGVPGLNPSLVDSKMVRGSTLALVRAILLGSQDPELNKGKRVVDADNTMAAYYLLMNDEQVAALTTFIRQEYGKQRDRVRSDYVARVREVAMEILEEQAEE